MNAVILPNEDLEALRRTVDAALKAINAHHEQAAVAKIKSVKVSVAAAALNMSVERFLNTDIPVFNESVRNGQDTRTRSGRKDYLVKVSDIDRWIENHKVESHKPALRERVKKLR